jgi:mannose/cellobiose epimerase-like protein (N-acyl-D-glucosamine 2-epimerase family)
MTTAAPASWLSSPSHRLWLREEALRLIEFFRATMGPDGWFVELDDDGRPFADAGERPQQLLTVTRAVHSYALGELLGVPGCSTIVEHGLDAIEFAHRDRSEGGYRALVTRDGSGPQVKATYGQAFVLLAASSALAAGHERARSLSSDVLDVIDNYFWREEEGAASESFSPDWEHPEAYRGANCNMHLCEAYLAASEVLVQPNLADRAIRILRRLINGSARAHGWALPEHYDDQWRPEYGYNITHKDDIFRPYGVTPGHLFQWSRLCCLAVPRYGEDEPWLLDAARSLFARAIEIGWDSAVGGIVYTTGFSGEPANDDRYWWPVTEAIGTSAVLAQMTGEADYSTWYRRMWEYAADHLLDHQRGGWYAQLDSSNQRKTGPWFGKPDIYHALQACIIPTAPLSPGVAPSLVITQ